MKKYFEKNSKSKNFNSRKEIFFNYYENPSLIWKDMNIKIKNLFFEKYFVLKKLKNELKNYKNHKIIFLLNRISKKNPKILFCNFLKKNHLYWNRINRNLGMKTKINIFVEKLFKIFFLEFISIFPKNEIVYL